VTYSNYQEANRAFYRHTVVPLVSRTARDLSAWFAGTFGPGVRLWYDADQVEGLAGERDALWARIGAASFLTDDEKREAGYWAGGRGGTALVQSHDPAFAARARLRYAVAANAVLVAGERFRRVPKAGGKAVWFAELLLLQPDSGWICSINRDGGPR
jgi:hypothetical protein